MFKFYVVTALRDLRQFKAATFITVFGLALGLSCFIAALGAVIFLTTGERHFSNSDRIYAITEEMHPRNVQNLDFASMRSSPPVARHLRIDFPQLEAVAAARDVLETPVSADGRLGYLHTAVVDADLLKIFDFAFAESSADNPLEVPRGAVITEETARKLFGTTRALGRTITLQSTYDVTVTGVLRDIRQPSHIGSTPEHILRFDILMTEETYWQYRRARNPNLPVELPFSGDSWGAPVSFTYVLLPANGSFTAQMLNEQLPDFTRRHTDLSRNVKLNFRHSAVPIASMRLLKLDVELFKGNGLSLATLILSLASMVLVVACINYANLSSARTLTRVRDLWLHRVLGARGVQIASQQWIESGLQVFLSLVLAVPLVVLVVLWFGQDPLSIVGRVIESRIFWAGMLTAFVGIVLVLGAYTTFVILRAYPLQALRGSRVSGGAGSVSRVLVGIQFAAASVLLIGLFVVNAQNNVVRTQALRVHADPVVVLEFPGRDANVEPNVLKETLLRNSAIREVSGIIRMPWSTTQSSITGISTEIGNTLRNALVDFVRHDFERAFDMKILAGRSFDAKFNDVSWPAARSTIAGTYPIVIDRSTAQQLGWLNPSDAIHRTVYWPLFSDGQLSGAHASLQIIGVLEDSPLRFDAGAGAQLQIYALVPGAPGQVIVRIDKSRVREGLSAIDTAWKTFVPYAPVKRRFLDELFEREYQTLDRANKIVAALTFVGLSIALMGLFGMATFVSQRRRREIGVRKTLGASVKQIVTMLLRDFSMPVVIANILIWPIAFVAAQKYLALFVKRIDLTAWPFVLSLCVALTVACLAVGGQAWRAARVHPADVLRHE